MRDELSVGRHYHITMTFIIIIIIISRVIILLLFWSKYCLSPFSYDIYAPMSSTSRVCSAYDLVIDSSRGVCRRRRFTARSWLWFGFTIETILFIVVRIRHVHTRSRANTPFECANRISPIIMTTQCCRWVSLASILRRQ